MHRGGCRQGLIRQRGAPHENRAKAIAACRRHAGQGGQHHPGRDGHRAELHQQGDAGKTHGATQQAAAREPFLAHQCGAQHAKQGRRGVEHGGVAGRNHQRGPVVKHKGCHDSGKSQQREAGPSLALGPASAQPVQQRGQYHGSQHAAQPGYQPRPQGRAGNAKQGKGGAPEGRQGDELEEVSGLHVGCGDCRGFAQKLQPRDLPNMQDKLDYSPIRTGAGSYRINSIRAAPFCLQIRLRMACAVSRSTCSTRAAASSLDSWPMGMVTLRAPTTSPCRSRSGTAMPR